MKDLHNSIVVKTVMAPIAVTTHTSDDDIDLQGYNSCEILGVTGAGTIDTTNKMTFRISHADDDGTGSSGSYAFVTDDDLVGAGTVTAGVPATPELDDEDQEVQFGYVGGKRFLKIELREAASTNAIIGLYVIKGDPLDSPEVT